MTGFKSSIDILASKPYFARWQLSAKLALALIDTTQAHGWYEQARLDKDFIRILLQGFFFCVIDKDRVTMMNSVVLKITDAAGDIKR